MQTLGAALEPEGPLVDVLLGLGSALLQKLRQAGNPLPAPVTVRALIDSGAEVSCADTTVLKPLFNFGSRP